jgi:hypothetical protein
MEPEVTKKFIEYLEKSEDLIMKEAPELFKETINYCYASSLIGIILAVVFLIICCAILQHSYTRRFRKRF